MRPMEGTLCPITCLHVSNISQHIACVLHCLSPAVSTNMLARAMSLMGESGRSGMSESGISLRAGAGAGGLGAGREEGGGSRLGMTRMAARARPRLRVHMQGSTDWLQLLYVVEVEVQHLLLVIAVVVHEEPSAQVVEQEEAQEEEQELVLE